MCPDEADQYEQPHLDLRCLQIYLFSFSIFSLLIEVSMHKWTWLTDDLQHI